MTFDSAHAPTATPVPGPGRRQLSPRRVTNEPPEREPHSLRETLCTFAGAHRYANKSRVASFGWLVIVFSRARWTFPARIHAGNERSVKCRG